MTVSLSIFSRLRILVWRIAVTLLILLMCVSFSAWEGSPWPLDKLLLAAGLVLVGVATIGRLWCSVYIAGYKNRQLITHGPYSVCRNPLYFFSFLGGLGVGMTTETLTVPSLVLVLFMLYYPWVIRDEEARQRQLHGPDFDSYRSRVPRFFPRLSLFSEPETYVMKPRAFGKALIDSLWFIFGVAGIELIEGLHECNLFLPVLLRLW